MKGAPRDLLHKLGDGPAVLVPPDIDTVFGYSACLLFSSVPILAANSSTLSLPLILSTMLSLLPC